MMSKKLERIEKKWVSIFFFLGGEFGGWCPKAIQNTLLFCLRKFDTLSKKEMKMIKTQIFWWKATKYAKNVELAPLTRDVICSKLQRDGKYIAVILSDESTLHVSRNF